MTSTDSTTRTPPAEADERLECPVCRHTAQGRREGWPSKRVRCATHTDTEFGDEFQCPCRNPMHTLDILKNVYESPYVEDM